MRQRITILNPEISHDDIVQLIDKKSFSLRTKRGFLVEKKLTLDQKVQYDLIRLLRVTSVKDAINNQVFGYNYLPGLTVTVQPLITDDFNKNEFYNQIERLLTELEISISVNSFIHNANSLYYYSDQVQSISWGSWKSEEQISDLLWRQDKVVIKTLEKSDNELLNFHIDDLYQEIGLFNIDPEMSTRDDIVLAGLRVVLDPSEPDEENVFKTLFHIKPRQRSIGHVSHKLQPNGLHPIIETRFDSNIPQDDDLLKCKLYYYASLNKSIFYDKYQTSIGDLVINNGEKDLELPEYKIEKWGQEILLEFPVDYNETIDLTLHSRYQKPNEKCDQTQITLTKPSIFYGCEVTDGYLLEMSPFDNKAEIGGNYEVYFTNNTVFYHFANDNGNEFQIQIPNGSSNFESINKITIISVSIGVFLILFKLFQVFIKRFTTTSSEKKNE